MKFVKPALKGLLKVRGQAPYLHEENAFTIEDEVMVLVKMKFSVEIDGKVIIQHEIE
ncbi:hypothetical protein ACBR35_02000 [Pasteurella multocida]|uniref:hypothetical protein n=1 Tax=Pasteurella multocida TaxID=747 RepID=UPI003D9AA99D